MNMLVRRMRLLSGTQFRQVQFNGKSRMRCAIQHRSSLVLAVRVYGEIFVAEDACRYDFWLLGQRGSSSKNGQQKSQIASEIFQGR